MTPFPHVDRRTPSFAALGLISTLRSTYANH